ncbi:NTP transferase domain-containing protein [Candidatus Dependentiae bacterium]|nr:NTP transferase domain-containing protein [Candidatus Dependentiae bacterium]
MNCQAIILAAGKSSRFNTGRSKLIEPICGQPMVLYPVSVMATLNVPTTVVVGHHKEEIKNVIAARYPSVQYIEQATQQGTGHAIKCTKEAWHADDIIIINGDTPLIDTALITTLYRQHQQQQAAMTFVTAHNIDPTLGNYGRVMHEGDRIAIVEAKDFIGDPQSHTLINAGIYILARTFLQEFIDTIPANEKTGEIYFTDLAAIASNHGLVVATVEAPFDTVRGVNTLRELWVVEQLKKSAIIDAMLTQGVRFDAPQTNRIDLSCRIGHASYIGTGVQLIGNCIIGSRCIIEPFVVLKDTVIDDDTVIRSHSVIEEMHIPAQSTVGPFAQLHPATPEKRFVGAVKVAETTHKTA